MKVIRRWIIAGIFILSLGCVLTSPLPLPADDQSVETPIPFTPSPMADKSEIPSLGRIVISEIIPGVKGNNNFEFIELYNAGTEAVDLLYWSLWYRMADTQDEKLVFIWKVRTEVPGYGHYLLIREGQTFDIIPDAVFTTALFEKKGGLILRDAEGEIVDAMGWGEAPTSYIEGSPASIPDGEASLERKPGGDAGNGQDSDDNASDFILLSSPNPQSRASEITPLPEERLEIDLETVDMISPGTAFNIDIIVKNNTDINVGDLTVVFPLPVGFEVLEIPADVEVSNETGLVILSWKPESIRVGATLSLSVTLRSPWSYGVINIVGNYVESKDFPLRTYGKTMPITVEGGSIPIATARNLTGQIVTVEGVATMYTGGYFAGSTGTKFYLDDGTGGIQVYCPGAQGIVSINIGDKVRVTGLIDIYRDSVELIPGIYPDQVEVLAEEGVSITPISSSVTAANNDAELLGRLITVEGQVTRLEEFAYSYEMDLMDQAGDTVMVYLDKESNIDPEFIEVGNLYQITGIIEVYNTVWQLKPRLASDFVEVFPEVLRLELMADNSIESGGIITYTITAFNHTPSSLDDVIITATIPLPPATISEILDNGIQETASVVWDIPHLAPMGGATSVHFSVLAGENGIVEMIPVSATADQYPEVVTSNPWMTFVGSGVPIWAIQGDGFISPFVRSVATTEGIVIGIFQELQGFWIQSRDPDDNPLTSEGLYVFSDVGDLPLVIGDYVQVTGKIREKSGQTEIDLAGLEDLVVIESDLTLPDASELNPPAESDLSKLYYESLEGMLVQVTEPAVAISPVSQFGEYVLVKKSWNIERVMRGESKGMMIFVDDGSAVTHYDQTTLPYVVKTGDQVSEIVGPLAYTFDNYKVQPITMPTVSTINTSLPELLPLSEGEFSIATFNVENFFDILDPHPTDPPRPSVSEYRQKLQKTAETILSLGVPTIIGLQEVENIGILEDLAQLESIARYGYIPILDEGFDSRGIDVGYLVRGDQAEVLSVMQQPAPEGLTSHPPLVIEVSIKNGVDTQVIYVINNHFLSMSAGELATEPQRNAQAMWNVSLVDSILAEKPDAMIAVIGDLNSFYDSPPIDTLRKGGLNHVYEFAQDKILYTYIYQGESETLDHILMTPPLFKAIQRVEVLHTNADFPPRDPADNSPQHVSDHDALLVVFSFK